MITRDEFLAGMRKGWERLEWNNGHFYASGPLDYTGWPIDWPSDITRDNATSACAIGAYAYAVGLVDDAEIWDVLYGGAIPERVFEDIVDASNRAGSKEAAIRAVEAIEWPS